MELGAFGVLGQQVEDDVLARKLRGVDGRIAYPKPGDRRGAVAHRVDQVREQRRVVGKQALEDIVVFRVEQVGHRRPLLAGPPDASIAPRDLPGNRRRRRGVVAQRQ
jgi:hypothetical protein